MKIESEMNFVSFGEKIPRRIIVSSRDFLLHITQNLISHLVRVILDACLDIYVTYEKHEAIKRIYIYSKNYYSVLEIRLFGNANLICELAIESIVYNLNVVKLSLWTKTSLVCVCTRVN